MVCQKLRVEKTAGKGPQAAVAGQGEVTGLWSEVWRAQDYVGTPGPCKGFAFLSQGTGGVADRL